MNEQSREREHAASCPYCRQGPGRCTCEEELACDRCGATSMLIRRVLVESVGGERDERIIEEMLLCEECEP